MELADPISLGAKITSVLETGRRESTYKLAVLLALIQFAVERSRADEALPVDLLVLADYVAELYRRQLEPFDVEGPLAQAKGRRSHLIDLLLSSQATGGELSFPRRRSLARLLAQMPLTHLQHGEAGKSRGTFLYDDSWLHKKVTNSELDRHDWQIVLLPGVGSALARLSTLLIPVLQLLWRREVQRFNVGRVDQDRLEAYMFGSSRKATGALRKGLTEIQGGCCFYCGVALREPGQIDHVLPWARTSLDDLYNLVVADSRCNGEKAALLPVPSWVVKAVHRDLEGLAESVPLGRAPERVIATAQGLYRWAPEGLTLWAGRGSFTSLGTLRTADVEELLSL